MHRSTIVAVGLIGLTGCVSAEDPAEPVDYVAIGPVFPTRSKEDPDPVVGLEMVRRAISKG